MSGKAIVLAASVALSGLNKLKVNQSRAIEVQNKFNFVQNKSSGDPQWNRNWQMNNENNFERHIYFIRHAQYEAECGIRLTDKGTKQGQSLNTWISQKDIKFNKVVVSTMKRAKDTWILINKNDVVSEHASIETTYSIKECKLYPKTLFSGEGKNLEKKQNQTAVSSFEAAFR